MSSKVNSLCNLNDDCLISIFRHLPLKDLNSVRSTCHQLLNIVYGIYRYHSKLKNINIPRMMQRLSNVDSLEHRIKCLKEYLQQFGHLIEHIDFDNNETNLPLAVIKEMCSDISMFSSDKLKSLKIYRVNFDDELLVNMRGIFNNLTKLDISDYWTEVVPVCSNLDTLIINGYHSEHPFNLNSICPKLKTFQFKTVLDHQQVLHYFNALLQVSHSSLALNKFIECQTSLVSLKLTLFGMTGINTESIANFKNLQELVLTCPKDERIAWKTSYEPLYNLRKLREICIDYKVSEFLLNSKSLETLQQLTISSCKINSALIHGLSRFRNLHYLSIHIDEYREMSDDVWKQLRKLNAITELYIDFEYIAEAVSKFMNNLVLTNLNMKTLTLSAGILTLEWFISLTKLESLESLNLTSLVLSEDGIGIFPRNIDELHPVDQIDWKSFKRFNKLKKLVLYEVGLFPLSDHRYLSQFFKELGSHSTLEQLSLSDFAAHDDIFQTTGNCPKLEKVEFNTIYLLNKSHLKMIENLKQMKQFAVNFITSSRRYRNMLDPKDPDNNLTNQSVVDLVEKWPLLESLIWKEKSGVNDERGNFNEMVFINIEFYDKLVDVVRNRNENRSLIVKFCPNIITVPYYAQKFVQIR